MPPVSGSGTPVGTLTATGASAPTTVAPPLVVAVELPTRPLKAGATLPLGRSESQVN